MTETSRNIPRSAFISGLFGILAAVVAGWAFTFSILGAILIGLLVALIVAIILWLGWTEPQATATATMPAVSTNSSATTAVGTDAVQANLRPQVLHLLLLRRCRRQLLPREPRMKLPLPPSPLLRKLPSLLLRKLPSLLLRKLPSLLLRKLRSLLLRKLRSLLLRKLRSPLLRKLPSPLLGKHQRLQRLLPQNQRFWPKPVLAARTI